MGQEGNNFSIKFEPTPWSLTMRLGGSAKQLREQSPIKPGTIRIPVHMIEPSAQSYLRQMLH